MRCLRVFKSILTTDTTKPLIQTQKVPCSLSARDEDWTGRRVSIDVACIDVPCIDLKTLTVLQEIDGGLYSSER